MPYPSGESCGDGVPDAVLVVADAVHGDSLDVVEEHVVGTHGEFLAVVVAGSRSEAVDDLRVPAQFLHGRKVVGQPLRLEPATSPISLLTYKKLYNNSENVSTFSRLRKFVAEVGVQRHLKKLLIYGQLHCLWMNATGCFFINEVAL